MIQVNSENFTSEVLDSKEPVLVDFFADWCQPCRALARTLAEVQGIKIVKVNIDEEPAIAKQFGVRGLPTLTVFVDGKPTKTRTGAASKGQVENLIEGLV